MTQQLTDALTKAVAAHKAVIAAQKQEAERLAKERQQQQEGVKPA